MTLPTTVFGILTILALVIPGIVYTTVRTSLQGFRDHDRRLGERVLQAVLVSVGFDAIYLIVLGWWLAPMATNGNTLLIDEPVQAGVALLLLGIGLPAFFGYLRHGNVPLIQRWTETLRTRAPGWLVHLTPVSGFNSAPTAWDWVATKQGGKWIRILTADGRWIGGWYADDSFIGLYPEPKDIFLRYQYVMSVDGKFLKPAPNGAGIWLSLENVQFVEWTDPEQDESESADA